MTWITSPNIPYTSPLIPSHRYSSLKTIKEYLYSGKDKITRIPADKIRGSAQPYHIMVITSLMHSLFAIIDAQPQWHHQCTASMTSPMHSLYDIINAQPLTSLMHSPVILLMNKSCAQPHWLISLAQDPLIDSLGDDLTMTLTWFRHDSDMTQT